MSAAKKHTPTRNNGQSTRTEPRTTGARSQARSSARDVEIRRYVGATVITGPRDQLAQSGYWPVGDFPSDDKVKFVDSANEARYVWRVGQSLYTVFIRDKLAESKATRTAKGSHLVTSDDVLSLSEFDGLTRTASMDRKELSISGTKAALIRHGAVREEDFPKGRKTATAGELKGRHSNSFKWKLERVGRGIWVLTYEQADPSPADTLALSLANKSRVRCRAARLDERYQAFLAKATGGLAALSPSGLGFTGASW